ncbi:hypothetical protein AA23498_2233 [Acetobacter nitrogenifigens DSM 23921 = NBRC 105050]|uniref:Bacteriocin n=1 Tax=Acetobacter nitrogenifigens DSM 23921 = NBRC 105050 TaxID=1120919 RepID=A0A511X706_9PROT|nr:hypothetical protein [Acetobacter nitrogenifigens]GBQ95169.1 hypothetical protein AA23498_2233 [Acetobacter nitrogenifigens DSM 23921 = NBRC 105050]GEN58737.1 hypothetical protein ANI02nite_06210 [Acetobacter nitrogenifigens DSM 23921 = NBRC 105050]
MRELTTIELETVSGGFGLLGGVAYAVNGVLAGVGLVVGGILGGVGAAVNGILGGVSSILTGGSPYQSFTYGYPSRH